MITKEHVANVCRIVQQESTCAFLAMGFRDGEVGAFCAKGTEIEAPIRARLAEGGMGAKGDNCDGWSN